MPLTLDRLPLGETGEILALSPSPLRRRLMELGFLPGAAVTPLHRSIWGDPTAYEVAGAVIALRSTDARGILLAEEGRSHV